MARTIKLLDGQSWDYNELLEQMLKDEFYYGYLGKAALSSSSLKKLLQSPKVYQASLNEQQVETKALSFQGTAKTTHEHAATRDIVDRNPLSIKTVACRRKFALGFDAVHVCR